MKHEKKFWAVVNEATGRITMGSESINEALDRASQLNKKFKTTDWAVKSAKVILQE